MSIKFQYLHDMQRNNRCGLWVAIILIVLNGGCTEEQVDEPHVLELRAIPKSITISDKYFYPKPFSIRAKYSDKTEKNISSRVSWLSENIALLSINKKGELKKNAECLQKKCVVSLIATDSESGKSIRLTVNMSQKKAQPNRQKTDTKKNLSEIKHKQDDLIEEAEVKEEFIEVETKGNIQNLQFSPQPSTTSTPNVTGISDRKSDKHTIDIDQIIFEENRVELSSGDVYQIKTLGVDILKNQHVNHKILYECYITEAFNLSVIVLPGCRLVAVKPGEVEIGIKIINGELTNIRNESVLRVGVNPVIINSIHDGFNYQIAMTEHNFQTWYLVSSLDSFSHYKAKISSDLSQNLRLFVYVHSALQYPICLNTFPANFNSVACYFQATENDVMLVVENMLERPIQANLKLVPVDSDLFQNQSLLKLQSPVNLALDTSVSAFILANESGGNNKHYYVFDIENRVDRDILINMYDFSSAIKLSVKWSGGFCNEKMTKVRNGEVICQVPASVMGKLQIVIDGNNGEFGVLNGPAAAEGGAFYKLRVNYAD